MYATLISHISMMKRYNNVVLDNTIQVHHIKKQNGHCAMPSKALVITTWK